MTVYEEEVEVRRPSGVGTKVLVLACAILAVLGSFWGIVWFIRAYVEPPRVMMPAPLVLAARESTPSLLPCPATHSRPHRAIEAQAAPAMAPPPVIEAQAAPAQTAPASRRPARDAGPTPSGTIADRWSAMDQFAPAAAPAPPPAPMATPVESAPAALATSAPDPDEVVEGSVPAIEGPAPLPRRKPIVTAARRSADPPLPRPRPEGAAQPSVWTAVPTDRRPVSRGSKRFAHRPHPHRSASAHSRRSRARGKSPPHARRRASRP